MDLDEIEALLEAPYKQNKTTPLTQSPVKAQEPTPARDASRERDSSRRRSRSRLRPSRRSTERSDKRIRDRSRSRSRHRDRSRSRHRHRDRHDTERRRDRSRSRHRDSRDHSNSRTRYRDHSNSRTRHRERDTEKRRYSERSYGNSDRSRSRHSRDHSRHSRHLERAPRPIERSSTADKFSWRSSSPEPALSLTERTARTVFCMQLSRQLRPDELAEFFSTAGKVNEVEIVQDSRGRPKGAAYVEFKDASSVPAALQKTGTRLLGAPIMVQEAASGENKMVVQQLDYQQQLQAIAAAPLSSNQPLPPPPATKVILPQKPTMIPTGSGKIYVTQLPINLEESDVKRMFSSFGAIQSIELEREANGLSKGSCIIKFVNSRDTAPAILKMNGFVIGGKPLKVVRAEVALKDSIIPSATGLQYRPKRVDPVAFTRAVHSPPQMPSKCMIIKNAFDPLKENEPDWHVGYQQDVKEECQKYGKVLHIYLDPKSSGFIFCKYEYENACKEAVRALDKRWFSGRQLNVGFLPEDLYNGQFDI